MDVVRLGRAQPVDFVRAQQLVDSQALQHLPDTTRAITRKEWPQVLEQLQQNKPKCKSLQLGFLALSKQEQELLSEALPFNTHLQTIEFQCGNVQDGQAEQLAQGLATNNTLTSVSLSGVPLAVQKYKGQGKDAADKHDLSAKGLRSVDAIVISHLIEHNAALTRLLLMDNTIADSGAVALAARLPWKLRELRLRGNSIRDLGATRLAEALEKARLLETLDLSSNHIGQVGSKALAAALQANSSLQRLHLSSNRIGPLGMMAFAKAMQENKTLMTLDVSGNHIGSGPWVLTLYAALQKRSMTVKLSENNVAKRDLERLVALMAPWHPSMQLAEASEAQAKAGEIYMEMNSHPSHPHQPSPISPRYKQANPVTPSPQPQAAPHGPLHGPVHIPPRTPMEQVLHRIWCEVLKLPPDQVGVITSLHAVSASEDVFGAILHKCRESSLSVTRHQLDRFPTIASLALTLPQTPPSTPIPRTPRHAPPRRPGAKGRPGLHHYRPNH